MKTELCDRAIIYMSITSNTAKTHQITINFYVFLLNISVFGTVKSVHTEKHKILSSCNILGSHSDVE